MVPEWRKYAVPQFLDGLDALHLDRGRIPRLQVINQFLAARTGFTARPVAGYVPAPVFFECLRRREFPTTITIRPPGLLDYLPEPDIFHDVCGHVPMHTDPTFAAALVRFGECAHRAYACGAGEELECLARFFWYTVEFGLMRTSDGLKACGSGLLSSHGELGRSIQSPAVHRDPARLGDIVNQPFEIDHFQPRLFVLDSFEHLFELIEELDHQLPR
jgi:phenylalanine-4-hydroxylase